MNEIIKKYIDDIFIKNDIPIIYSGSYALVKQGYLNRGVGDIDIILNVEYYALVKKLVINNLAPNNGRYKGFDVNKVICIDLGDGLKIDVFFGNINLSRVIRLDGEDFLSLYDIIKYKIDLLQNESNNKEKHINDITEVMTSLKKAVVLEDVPF